MDRLLQNIFGQNNKVFSFRRSDPYPSLESEEIPGKRRRAKGGGLTVVALFRLPDSLLFGLSLVRRGTTCARRPHP